MTLRAGQLEEALRRTGEHLHDLGGDVSLYIIGGSAGLLGGVLDASRTTGDVDVVRAEPEHLWERVREAANRVARELQLPHSWINDGCRMYSSSLPLEWETRCEQRRFGPLVVCLIHRKDFIAAKIVSAPKRPHDYEDLKAVRPTQGELDFASSHIDRLESESLDPDCDFTECRSIVDSLRATTGGK